jgi:hypothetical protein
MALVKSNKPLSTLSINSLKPGNSILDTGEYRGLRVECGNTELKTFIYRYRSPVIDKVKRFRVGRFQSNKLGSESLGISLAEARVEFLSLKAHRNAGVLNRYHFLRHLTASFDNVLHALQATADFGNYAGACCYKTFQCNQNITPSCISCSVGLSANSFSLQ